MNKFGRLTGLACLLAIIAVWELTARLGLVTPQQLPAPSTIAIAGWNDIVDGDMPGQVWLTAQHLFGGFILAAVVGVPLGFVLGRTRLLYAALEPMIEFLRPMPVIAILPIAVLIMGLGNMMIYSVIAFGAGWVILLHAMDGARGIDPVLIETGQTFRVPRMRRFLTIILPAATPQTFTGLRIGLSIAVIVTVVVELVSGFAGGLGDYIGTLEGALQTSVAYAGIVIISLIGYLLGESLLLVEGRLMAWHRGFKRQ
jgi:ABC-type nitrate/sulfonate/bicarbonate transport system permease component